MTSKALEDVITERQRQIEKEGWTTEHDDQHDSGEMAGAAACYAIHVNQRQWVMGTELQHSYATEPVPFEWPWDPKWWKPVTPRRDLVRAAALLLAEIERIDRSA